MGKSFQIAHIAGIPVKLHWSFGLIVLFVAFVFFTSNIAGTELFFLILAILALFGCVILHEFGHAIVAKQYGVKTKDIIISPIGGVARLETLPKNALDEFFIAIAGPVVNIIIALLVSFIVIIFLKENPFAINWEIQSVSGLLNFMKFILQINIALFLFNLIPAFPMDGGRILRSLLALKIGRARSTKIASVIGRIIAILFVGIGFYLGHLVLTVIGVFVFFMARQEYKVILIEEKMKSTPLSKIYRTEFTRLNITDTMSVVFDLMDKKPERSFLVFDQMNRAIGILHHYFIQVARKKQALLEPISYYTSDKLFALDENEKLEKAKSLMQKEGLSIIAVEKNGKLNGVLDRQDIIRFMQKI